MTDPFGHAVINKPRPQDEGTAGIGSQPCPSHSGTRVLLSQLVFQSRLRSSCTAVSKHLKLQKQKPPRVED